MCVLRGMTFESLDVQNDAEFKGVGAVKPPLTRLKKPRCCRLVDFHHFSPNHRCGRCGYEWMMWVKVIRGFPMFDYRQGWVLVRLRGKY